MPRGFGIIRGMEIWRIGGRFCAVAACLCGMLVASSADGAALSALQKAMDSDAEWTMARQLPGASRTLESRDTVSCRTGKGIVWAVKEPFESSVEMTPNAMIFTDEDGRREKSLGELPHDADIRKATDAFVAGNTNAFDGVFAVTEKSFADRHKGSSMYCVKGVSEKTLLGSGLRA